MTSLAASLWTLDGGGGGVIYFPISGTPLFAPPPFSLRPILNFLPQHSEAKHFVLIFTGLHICKFMYYVCCRRCSLWMGKGSPPPTFLQDEFRIRPKLKKNYLGGGRKFHHKSTVLSFLKPLSSGAFFFLSQ